MIKRMHCSLIIAGAMLLLAIPLACPGRVFFSRLVEKGSSFFDTTGWRRIYQAPMVLNGGRLTLSVYGCDEPFIQVMTKLKEAFKPLKESEAPQGIFAEPCEAKDTPPPCGTCPQCYAQRCRREPQGCLAKKGRLVENSDSAYLQSRADKQIARVLAVALPDPFKSLVFSIAQSQPEFSKSSAAADKSESFGAALLPGSSLQTTIANADTGARLETRFSAAAPENAINEIAENLERSGWRSLYPDSGAESANRRFMIFQRSAELCVVSAGSAAEAGQLLQEKRTCVTILTKRLN